MLFIILTIIFTSLGFSQETISTRNFTQNLDAIIDQTQNYDPHEVLIVIDNDNTLLAHKQALGSDQWFAWQRSLIGTQSPYRLADSFQELVGYYRLALNYHDSKMRLTDTQIHQVIKYLDIYGYSRVIMTKREAVTLSGTRRELVANGVRKTHRPPSGIIEGKVKGFTRDLYYKDGLAMTAGQDKGEFLKHILNKSGDQYKAIVIIDDHLNNVDDIHRAFANDNVQTIGLHYQKEKSNVSRFKRMSKKSVHQDFLKLKAFCDLSYL